MLPIACCLLPVACCLLPVVCCRWLYRAAYLQPQSVPGFAPPPDLHWRALLLPPPVLAACPAPLELEEPEPLLLPVGPTPRGLSWRRAVSELS
jgi:hypothetical protein